MNESIWLKGAVEGGSDELSETMRLDLSAVAEFIRDSAPYDWEDEIDQDVLPEYRSAILRWDNKKLLSFCKNNYVWDDPTYAKALLDVIDGKISKAI